MAAVIALLRGVNVGGHNKIKMEALRALCMKLKLRDVATHVQSGNVVFATAERDLSRLAEKIEDAIEREFGFRPAVVLRTAAELRDVVTRNPFAGRSGIEPSKLLVTFFAADQGKKLSVAHAGPEELRLDGRELFIYFPNGIAGAKLPSAVGKMPGTARNWNTVTKLLEMAEKLEAS